MRPKHIWLFAVPWLFAIEFGFAPSGRTQEPAPSTPVPRIHEELIAEVSPQSEIDGIFMSTAHHVLWTERRSGHKQALWLNSKQLTGAYDEVRYCASTPEGEQVACTAKHVSTWVLVINGQERSAEYDDMFSPAITLSGRFAVPLKNGRKWQMLVDGQFAGPEFEVHKLFREIPVSKPVFDTSGSHYAFLGRRHGKWMTYVDGNALGVEIDWIRQEMGDAHGKFIFPFQPQWVGAHIFAAGQINNKWCWIVDGHPEPLFDVLGRVHATEDGKHYAYAGLTGLKGDPVTGSIVKDGKIIANYPGTPDKDNTLSGVWPLHRPWLDGISDPAIAADGTVFYAARRGENDVVVSFNGAPGPSFKNISDVVVTSDGRHIAYAGWGDSHAVLVRDQVAGPLFAERKVLNWIKLSADGGHVALAASVFESKQSVDGYTLTARVFVDGKPNQDFQSLSGETPAKDFHFNEDGKHYAYQIHTLKRIKCWLVGCTDAYQRLIVIDGVQLSAYEHVYPGMQFIDPHMVQFLARQEKRLLLVTYALE